ncbi:MAG: hypothetical protein WCL00_09510, partial [Bacteroidota bacterium]
MAQSILKHIEIKWNKEEMVRVSETEQVQLNSFYGSTNLSSEFGVLPVFVQRFPLNSSKTANVPVIQNPVFEPVIAVSEGLTRDFEKIPGEIAVSGSVVMEKDQSYLLVSLMPLRKNSSNGAIERLVSFDLRIDQEDAGNTKGFAQTKSYAN